MGDCLASQIQITLGQVRNSTDVICSVDELADLATAAFVPIAQRRNTGPYLGHCQVPIRFYPFRQIDQGYRHNPVLDIGRIRVEREYFEVNRVEIIDRDRGLRV
jgi:hypothetical protein